MKRIYKYLMTFMAGATLLGVTSCRDESLPGWEDNMSEYVKVSFHLAPEAAAVSTRGGYVNDDPSAKYLTGKISDGGKVDMVVYAVYDKDGNLLTDYSEGVDSQLFSVVGEAGHGDGQTIKKVEKFPCTVNLTLKRGEEYTIAFWAQNSKAYKFYNTEDLRKVEVVYNEVEANDDPVANDVEDNGTETQAKPSTPNNDELRDAFCRSVTLTAGENNSLEQNVYLYRPLAQINVGTAGYDYEIVTRNANVDYKYSKIRINRVARYLDVVADKTIVNNKVEGNDDEKYDYENRDSESFAVVDFGYAPFPAYVNENLDYDRSEDVFPKYTSFTKWDWEYNKASGSGWSYSYDDENGAYTSSNPHYQDMLYKDYVNEQFLQAHIYEDSTKGASDMMGDSDNDGYLDYANLDNTENYNKKSETFKWLSMCYVLTSSSQDEARVINNVKVWVASDDQGANEKELINIDHVPVQRNWRTNIVGELFTTENDFIIKLDRDFAGDYNLWKDNDSWVLSGPLAEGVYYDAESDVIEISSVKGLEWFQKMVNGNITVREAPKAHPEMAGNYYKYYKVTQGSDYEVKSESIDFRYDGISEPSDETLKERILTATHQKWNKLSDGKWPATNSFPFTATDGMDLPEGMKKQATVKLMADLDLSSFENEWVPIGFDGRIGDQLGWRLTEVRPEGTGARTDNRIFYGIFDGNDHTISNLSTKRFSANVHETAQQENGYRTIYNTIATRHPSDNPQWFARGLFGQIGGSAKITNVRLSQVDIKGCNGVGGIVGVAYGDDIEISGCIVDGGYIEATPMYRGDSYNYYKDGAKSSIRYARTFARGVYTGGIVGYFYTVKGKCDNNVVRNVHIKGVRRLGALIGSINPPYLNVDHSVADEGVNLTDGNWGAAQPVSEPASIQNNRIENVSLIATSFVPYGERAALNSSQDASKSTIKDNVTRTGFGWASGNLEMYAQKFVGGHEKEADQCEYIKPGVFAQNTESGMIFSHLPISHDYYYRTGTIEKLSLEDMPMLSSWYTDYVNLNDNYYGKPSANSRVRLYDFKFFSGLADKSGYNADGTYTKSVGQLNINGTIASNGTNFYYPIPLPELTDVTYDGNSSKVGVFVESVILDGKGGIGGRSVITSTDVTGNNDCVMYITARDRNQFGGGSYTTGTLNGHSYWPDFMKGYEGKSISSYKVPTIVKNVVLRGEPYADTGILFAPNKSMHRVELENVTVYDVYKTLAMNSWSGNNNKWWPNTSTTYDAYGYNGRAELKVKDSNLRGYTVPGIWWSHITYENVTFERGANTGHGTDEYTCKVDLLKGTSDESGITVKNQDGDKVNTDTKFINCYFKAPYIIDMTDLEDLSRVTFTNCQGTAANQKNVIISLTDDLKSKGCNWIYVKRNEQGEPYVEYYKDRVVLQTDYIK